LPKPATGAGASYSREQTPELSAELVAGPRVPAWVVAALLALITLLLYWPATSAGFVNFDDGFYVTSNPLVQRGVTLEGIASAFRNPVCYTWHPLTVLSHMLDCQLFGLHPWGHHLPSVLLHALNTVLVFLLLRRLTGSLGSSALVAALFGWHPLQVESVAWVAERKNVLSTGFGLLALLAYARYVQGEGGHGPRSVVSGQEALAPHATPAAPRPRSATCWYLAALSFFALGLLSKPMLVTWPFVLLILDYWPLNRVRFADVRLGSPPLRSLVLEKLPFLALTVTVSVVTFLVQRQGKILATVDALPLGARCGNAAVSYCRYLGKLFCPVDLAALYPHPGHWPEATVLLAGAVLAGVSVLAFWQRARRPFLVVGWLWYLGTLLPVIQLVQTGTHAMADRYAYVPILGVLIALIYGATELAGRRRFRVIALAGASAAAMIFCLRCTHRQIGYWQDSEALARHAIEVTQNNAMAHYLLGNALSDKGEVGDAIRQYQEAIRLKPGYVDYHYNLGTALARAGRLEEALGELGEALRMQPDNALAHINLGNCLDDAGRTDEAIREYGEALRLQPGNAAAHLNLGICLAEKGRPSDAVREYEAALRLDPTCNQARQLLEQALEQKTPAR
jgi:protein O-mannosyl-transferase